MNCMPASQSQTIPTFVVHCLQGEMMRRLALSNAYNPENGTGINVIINMIIANHAIAFLFVSRG